MAIDAALAIVGVTWDVFHLDGEIELVLLLSINRGRALVNQGAAEAVAQRYMHTLTSPVSVLRSLDSLNLK